MLPSELQLIWASCIEKSELLVFFAQDKLALFIGLINRTRTVQLWAQKVKLLKKANRYLTYFKFDTVPYIVDSLLDPIRSLLVNCIQDNSAEIGWQWWKKINGAQLLLFFQNCTIMVHKLYPVCDFLRTPFLTQWKMTWALQYNM